MKPTHLLAFWLLTSVSMLRAQQVEPLTVTNQEALYEAGMQCLERFYLDSALHYFVLLTGNLALYEDKDIPFEQEVLLRKGEVLEKLDKDDEALALLRQVSDDAVVHQLWDVQANAALSLARLHEKLDFEETCRENLSQARQLIERHGLKELRPRLAVRLASYHRVFGQRDSALIHVQTVLDEAPRYNQRDLLANGHMLKAMLTHDTAWQASVADFEQAGQLWKEIGNYSASAFISLNIAKLLYANDRGEQALRYSDSSLVLARVAESLGYGEKSIYWYNYQLRANVFHDRGQHDSAWYYLNTSYELQLEDTYLANARQIAEITAEYKDEQKNITIAEQSERLRLQANQRRLWLWLFVVALLSVAALLFLYMKLRQANQNLGKALDYQMMLQSEIHHRVKNNLQIIISLLELQSEQLDDPLAKAGILQLSDRIYSIAAVHQMLYANDWTAPLSISTYIQLLCDYYRQLPGEGQQFRYHIDAPERVFHIETMMPLGIIINELLTNSLKYGRATDRPLEIHIQFEDDKSGVKLTYRDNGPGFSTSVQPTQKSLGTYLLESMARQLRGTVRTYNAGGAVTEVAFSTKQR